MRAPPRLLAATAGLAALCAGAAIGAPERGPARGGAAAWLGPLAPLAADLAWIGFQRARLAGRDAEAIARAETALTLAPGSTDGWRFLAAHLALDHASPQRRPELEARRRWFAAGLAAAERGAELVREPEELDLFRALVCVSRLELDPDVLPGGPPALRAEAARAFRRAAGRLVPEDPRAAEWRGYAEELEADGR